MKLLFDRIDFSKDLGASELIIHYQIIHNPPPKKNASMPEVTIRSADPVRLYWRLVFYGAAEPDRELIVTSKDDDTGIITVSVKMD